MRHSHMAQAISVFPGVNLEVTAGEADKEKVLASLRKAMDARSPAGAGEKDAAPQATATAAPAVTAAPPQEATAASTETNVTAGGSSADSKAALEERVARAKDLLEKRRQQKLAEEKDKEKNSESERRALGKNLQVSLGRYVR